MAGHRSLAPAVMVRIHPGQLLGGGVRILIALLCAGGLPLGLSGAPGPITLATPSASVVLQPQLEERSASDSTRIRGQAEGAQARFERIRRRLLPYVWAGGRRPCEERIGRLCLWHGGEDDWEPVPDPSELVEARNDLLTILATAAGHIPADEWILGQRIRYLGEAGEWEDAARVARACGGAALSWCRVLEGFALHGMGRYETALQRFRRGFETMDSEEARKWQDPSVLLDGKGSDVLEDAADEGEWDGITTEALPDDLATLSDLILLGDSPLGPSMRSSTRLEADKPLVIGWEVFGLGWRPEDVSFELSFYEKGEGFFGRIGRWLGFGSREEPLQLVWSEPGPAEIGPWFRSVEVTIPEVDVGDYVFRLRVTATGREELVRTRTVEIVP